MPKGCATDSLILTMESSSIRSRRFVRRLSDVFIVLHGVTQAEINTAVWQLQPKVVQTVQLHVAYEFVWIRRTCDYIYLNGHYCVLFSSRLRIRVKIGVRNKFSVWLVTCYTHVFLLPFIVIVALPIYTGWTVVKPCVNCNVSVIWEWSKFDSTKVKLLNWLWWNFAQLVVSPFSDVCRFWCLMPTLTSSYLHKLTLTFFMAEFVSVFALCKARKYFSITAYRYSKQARSFGAHLVVRVVWPVLRALLSVIFWTRVRQIDINFR